METRASALRFCGVGFLFLLIEGRGRASTCCYTSFIYLRESAEWRLVQRRVVGECRVDGWDIAPVDGVVGRKGMVEL